MEELSTKEFNEIYKKYFKIAKKLNKYFYLTFYKNIF